MKPNPDAAEVRRVARRAASQALAALERLLTSEHPLVALKAAMALLERGYGRPTADPHEEMVPADLRERPIAEQVAWLEDARGRFDLALANLRARQHEAEPSADRGLQ